MPRIGYRGHPADESGIQSLFATDLFLCFQYVVKTIEAEVPVVTNLEGPVYMYDLLALSKQTFLFLSELFSKNQLLKRVIVDS